MFHRGFLNYLNLQKKTFHLSPQIHVIMKNLGVLTAVKFI